MFSVISVHETLFSLSKKQKDKLVFFPVNLNQTTHTPQMRPKPAFTHKKFNQLAFETNTLLRMLKKICKKNKIK